MLIQQMDNRQSLTAAGSMANLLTDEQAKAEDGLALFGRPSSSVGGAQTEETGCCLAQQKRRTNSLGQLEENSAGLVESTIGWLSCVWSSARACSKANERALDTVSDSRGPSGWFSILWKITDFILAILSSLLASLFALILFAVNKLAGLPKVAHSVYFVWLSRWRSPIIQRLMQSMLVQLYYIGSLLLDDYEMEE